MNDYIVDNQIVSNDKDSLIFECPINVRKSIESTTSIINEEVKEFIPYLKNKRMKIPKSDIQPVKLVKSKRQLYCRYLNWKGKKKEKSIHFDSSEILNDRQMNTIKRRYPNKLCYVFYNLWSTSTRRNEWNDYIEYSSNRKFVIPIRSTIEEKEKNQFENYSVLKNIDHIDGNLSLLCILNALLNYDDVYDFIHLVDDLFINHFKYVLQAFYKAYLSK